MAWVAAIGYVAAAAALLGAVSRRDDPRVRFALDRLRTRADVASLDACQRVGRRIGLPKVRKRLRLRFGVGRDQEDRVLGTKALLAAVGLAAGLTALPSGPVPAATASVVLLSAGFSLPEFVMARRERSARAGAAASVPDLLDLVAIGVTAGLTPRLALERASTVVEGPLGEELDRARADVALGRSWPQVLRSSAARIGLRELARLASTLDRSDRLGAPVAARLRDLARDGRARHRALEEERARRAPVAMLFPLVFLILPAFVLAAVVPAVLSATRGVP